MSDLSTQLRETRKELKVLRKKYKKLIEEEIYHQILQEGLDKSRKNGKKISLEYVNWSKKEVKDLLSGQYSLWFKRTVDERLSKLYG